MSAKSQQIQGLWLDLFRVGTKTPAPSAPKRQRGFRNCLIFSLLILGHASGCATIPSRQPTTNAGQTVYSIPAATTQVSAAGTDSAPSVPGNFDDTSVERLAQLWTQRRQPGTISDYPIGPGDVLEISVPAMEELKSRTVRVSGDGTIGAPFLGIIQVNGLTEEKLRQDITHRLEEYMYRPRVNLFVREYRSRQVAVLGAVSKPGFYSLASGADTLRDMISLAGGTNETAAPWICLTPSEEAGAEQVPGSAVTTPLARVSTTQQARAAAKVEPLIIALDDNGNQTSEYLSLPSRPGDIIMVPTRGEVLVHGWVAKPGSYPITPGLTMLGAVMAAGGPLFAADLNTVRILRRDRAKQETSLYVNLDQVRDGESPDVDVRSGDIIVLAASGVKVVPYSLYQLVASMLHVGANLPLY